MEKKNKSSNEDHIHFSKGKNHYVAIKCGDKVIIYNANDRGIKASDEVVNEYWVKEAIKYLF